MHTIGSLIREGRNLLVGSSPSADLDAALILADQLNIDRIKIISSPETEVSIEDSKSFLQKIERRKGREPVAYITGKKEFYGLEFEVSPAVLIPRPETEMLVELVLKKTRELNGRISILDLGTGSGCLPVSIAKKLEHLGQEFHIDAVDISQESLEVCKKNILKHNVKNIKLILSNWYSEISTESRYNIIISNPPYIAINDKNVSPETAFEPKGALYAEEKGLADYSVIINQAETFLENTGSLLLEIGSTQADSVMVITAQAFGEDKCIVHKDLAGNDRVVEINLF